MPRYVVIGIIGQLDERSLYDTADEQLDDMRCCTERDSFIQTFGTGTYEYACFIVEG